jgi:hypothetical protein
VIVGSPTQAIDPDELERRTGWAIKPQGACKGEVCVPLPKGSALTATLLRDRLGMPLVGDEERGVWALGPSTATGRALESAAVPDIELPDVDGNPFKLSSLHGRKAIVVAWASW